MYKSYSTITTTLQPGLDVSWSFCRNFNLLDFVLFQMTKNQYAYIPKICSVYP